MSEIAIRNLRSPSLLDDSNGSRLVLLLDITSSGVEVNLGDRNSLSTLVEKVSVVKDGEEDYTSEQR